MELHLRDLYLPMRHAFTIALGTTTVQHNLLVELHENGVSGYGEGASSHAYAEFTADSRIEDATPITFERGDAGKIAGFILGAQKYTRAPVDPAPLPPEWRAYIGSYGPDFIPLVVSERHGHLYAMTENMVDYRLTPMNRNVCTLPPGMYVDEQIVFLTDADGRARAVNFASMTLPRRP